MAVQKSLDYLSSVQHMEMRVGANSLFQMTASNSKTVCDRVDTSYDLVVRDKKFGIPRFCISGAELSDHAVKVYMSAVSKIGVIKNSAIFIPEEDDANSGIPIQTDFSAGCKYYVNNDSISCTSNLMVLQLGSSTAVAVKAMMIAFAIQCARRSNPIAESLADQSNSIYNPQTDPFSSANKQFQAQPLEHKPHRESIFDSTDDKNVSAFLRGAGWGMKGRGCFFLIFNASLPYDVWLIVQHYKIGNQLKIKMVGANGNEQALASSDGEVTYGSVEIGKIVSVEKAGNQKETILQSSENSILESPGGQDRERLRYLDKSGTEVATISKEAPPLIKLIISKTLPADEKKLILCRSIFLAQNFYYIDRQLPQIKMVSSVTCNCESCEQCLKTVKTSIKYNFVEKAVCPGCRPQQNKKSNLL